MEKIKIYAKSIFIPVLTGTVIGIITSQFINYNTLQKPPLSPPGYIFPIVWTIIYILMGIGYGILKSENKVDEKTKIIYYTQLIINALWSIIFFVLEWKLFSIIWIILLDIVVLLMIKNFYSKNKIAGLLQIPYLIWILFATYLTIGIYILNK